MNQSDLILEFIDGTLDAQREQGLFSQMADHPELRAELRQYVMIGDAVRADREAYMPPADLERRLFGGLGVLPPTAAGGVAAAAGGAGTASGTLFATGVLAKLKSAILPLFVGVVVGGLLAGGSVYLSMNSTGDGSTIAQSGQGISSSVGDKQGAMDGGGLNLAQGTDHTKSADNLNQQSSVGDIDSRSGGADNSGWTQKSTEATDNGGLNGSTRSRLVSRTKVGQDVNGGSPRVRNGGIGLGSSKESNQGGPSNIATAQDPDEIRTPAVEEGQDTPNALGQLSSNKLTNIESTSLVNDRAEAALQNTVPKETPVLAPQEILNAAERDEESTTSRSPSAKLPELELQAQRFDDGQTSGRSITVEMRKALTSGPFVDNNARQIPSSFLSDEDLVIGAHYSPDSRYYIGVEYGRERFAQKLFYNQDDTLFIEQRPMINWFGLAIGANLQAFNVPLFVQGDLGASQYGGPMVRGRVGMDLMHLFGQRSSALSVPLSVETSSLVYRYNDQYLVTGNWGINAGAQFRFGF